ncbi:hypothetical protein ACFL3P_00925 [Pseudomonadota bacterium]
MGNVIRNCLFANNTDRMTSIRTLITVCCLLNVGVVLASPTSNEFEECHKLASKYLFNCLNENMNSSSNGKCWIKSRESYKSCHTRVIKRHDRSEMKKRSELDEAIEAMELNEQTEFKE